MTAKSTQHRKPSVASPDAGGEPSARHDQNESRKTQTPAAVDGERGPFSGLAAIRVPDLIRKTGILIGFVGLLALFSILSPGFFGATTLLNIAVQSSIAALVGIGVTFVIIGGGIDLSVGSMLAFCAVVLGDLMVRGVPIGFALLAVLALGVVAGGLNALLIQKLRIAPFVVTLGGLSFYRGFALLYTDGQPIFGLPSGFRDFFGGSLLGMPTPVWIVLVVALAAHITLWHTRWGRHVLAVGGDVNAARLSGVNVQRVRAATYMVAGFCTACAAVVLIARLGAAEPGAAQALELTAIATAVIGGASLSGGRGSIAGTVLGALIIGTLQAGLTIMGVQAFYQLVAIGALIIIAVALDPRRKEEA